MTNIRDLEPEPLVVSFSADGSESLTFDVGIPDKPVPHPIGWAALHSPTLGPVSVKIRFGAESADPTAPIEIRELLVAAKGPEFNSPLLRAIPFARMVAAVNRHEVIETLRPLLGPHNLWEDAGHGSRNISWMFPPRKPVTLKVPSLQIEDPKTRRKPDSFYREVAKLYLVLASLSNRPAQEMAEANQLPVSTVHRWLKEARQRGALRLPGTQQPTQRGTQS